MPSFLNVIIAHASGGSDNLCTHRIINANNIIINRQQEKPYMIASKIKRSKTPNNISSRASLTVIKTNTNKKVKNVPSQSQLFLQSFNKEFQKLPPKSQTQKITVTKSAQDPFYNYKYRDGPSELGKRSTLPQVSELIFNLIKKSEETELSSTQKYMLSGYIDVFINQHYQSNQLKDNITPTIQKLKQEWVKLSKAWELYKIKIKKCRISVQDDERNEKAENNFRALYKQIQKIQNGKQKLQPIKKLMKKFYNELIN